VIHTPIEAENFLQNPPASVKAVVVDRRFGEDAIGWLNRLADRNRLRDSLPIIVIRGAKPFPRVTSRQPVHEVEGRFSRSSC
jgi:hypothetical protein